MDTKNIVILGGSYAGASTAHYLLKHSIPQLPNPSQYRIVLVSASSEFLCRPACPRAMIADHLLDQSKLFVSIADQFTQYPQENFEFVHGTAKSMDTTARIVTVDRSDGREEVLSFYSLVLATGSSTPSPLFGMNKDSQALRDAWKAFRQSLSTAKSIVIAGGGPTGVETAGELGEYLNGSPAWFMSSAERPNVDITLVTGSDQILPYLPVHTASKAVGYLAAVGVKVITNTRVEAVDRLKDQDMDDPNSPVKITLSSGQVLTPDIYIPSTGVKPNTSFVPAALLTSRGYVDTSKSTLRVNNAGPRIYAIGDVASYARAGVHTVLASVPVVCHNIRRDLFVALGDEVKGGVDKEFKEDTRTTQMVPIGQSKGVGVAMGWSVPSFMVWLIKGRDYWLWMIGNLWNGKFWSKEAK